MRLFGRSIAVFITLILCAALGTAPGAETMLPPANASDNTGFRPVDPTRILDTRSGLGAPKATLKADGTMTLKVLGVAGIPTQNVAAVVLNITVTEAKGPGFITAYPAGTKRPLASNLNYEAGKNIANHTVVHVGEGGSISLYSLAETHLVADIQGYYLNSSTFVKMQPKRVFDSRTTGSKVKAKFLEQRVDVKAALGLNENTSAGTYVVNITVTEPEADGFVTVYPAGGILPKTSNVNFRKGQTIAGAAMLQAGELGQLKIYSHTNAHVIIDVVGRLTDTATFNPMLPARILDTRSGYGARKAAVAAKQKLTFFVNHNGVLSHDSLESVALNITVAEPRGPGFVTAYPGGARPEASTVNFAENQVISNAAIVPVAADGSVTLYTMTDTHLVVDVTGYFHRGNLSAKKIKLLGGPVITDNNVTPVQNMPNNRKAAVQWLSTRLGAPTIANLTCGAGSSDTFYAWGNFGIMIRGKSENVAGVNYEPGTVAGWQIEYPHDNVGPSFNFPADKGISQGQNLTDLRALYGSNLTKDNAPDTYSVAVAGSGKLTFTLDPDYGEPYPLLRMTGGRFCERQILGMDLN